MNNTFEKVKKLFPFEGYMDNSPAPYFTVETTLEKHLSKGQTILDFGSGPCDKTAIASALGFQCTACDNLQDEWYSHKNNTGMILDFAKSMDIHFEFDLDTALKSEYDMVMMNDVLEHIHNSPRTILNSLIGSIKTEGYLFITVPNITNLRKRLDVLRGRTNLPKYDLFYWYPDPWRGPVREYTRGDLVQMTEFLGLQLVELSTVHHMLGNLSAKLVPTYKLVTKVFPDLADTWLLVAKKPENWKARDHISDSDFAQIYKKTSTQPNL